MLACTRTLSALQSRVQDHGLLRNMRRERLWIGKRLRAAASSWEAGGHGSSLTDSQPTPASLMFRYLEPVVCCVLSSSSVFPELPPPPPPPTPTPSSPSPSHRSSSVLANRITNARLARARRSARSLKHPPAPTPRMFHASTPFIIEAKTCSKSSCHQALHRLPPHLMRFFHPAPIPILSCRLWCRSCAAQ